MALTIGTGPFGRQPAGQFDVAPPSRPLLFWEPFPKRLRVVAGGETIVDSRRVVALHATGMMMRLAVPPVDVRRERLVRNASETDARLGEVQGWSIEGGATIARSIAAPPAAAAALKDLVILDLDRADAWYLEDELGYAHPRDPYHRFDVHRASRHVVVRAGGTLVAETRTPAILFETSTPVRYYLPPDEVRPGVLAKSATVSQCPYKGDGQHWHVVAGGTRIADAAWTLTTPMDGALAIPHWISFYPDKVSVEVDGERLA